jgi:predicted transcriptional regulator
MNNEEKVLEAMVSAGQPLGAAKIVELTGLDKKEVDKAMKILKESGQIVSPKRCMWEPAK